MTDKDLATMLQILDLASQRGLFTASQMLAVGTLYNNIKAAYEDMTGSTAEKK